MARRDTVVHSALVQLRELIEREHAVGDQLPNEKELAETLEVSRGTVREALGVLASEGFVTRSWGVGTFVSTPPHAFALSMASIQSYRDRVVESGLSVSLLDARCEQVPAPETAATALRLPVGTDVWKVLRLFAVEGKPTAYMVEYIPMTIASVAVDPSPMLLIECSLFAMLNGHVDGIVAKVVTDVSATAIAQDHSEVLGLAVGTPVLTTEQVTYSAEDEALAFGTTTDVTRLRITRVTV